MNELASALRAEVDRAEKYFRSLGEEEVTHDRGTGKWVRKEILGHLIDSACDNHQRIVRAQFADPFLWPGYDQVAWVTLHRYRERPWTELADLWAAMNRQVAAVIEAVPGEKLQTSCTIGGHEPAPLEWWMRDYLRHLKHHLAQLEGA
jgi:hypothetical protein